MVNLGVKIHNLDLKNPVMTASGTCGFGEEIAQLESGASGDPPSGKEIRKPGVDHLDR